MLGKIFLPIFAVFLLLFLIGAVMAVIAKRKNPSADKEADEILSQKTVENVNDLGDRFNRARYMDRDGN